MVGYFPHFLQLFDDLKCWYSWAFSNSSAQQHFRKTCFHAESGSILAASCIHICRVRSPLTRRASTPLWLSVYTLWKKHFEENSEERPCEKGLYDTCVAIFAFSLFSESLIIRLNFHSIQRKNYLKKGFTIIGWDLSGRHVISPESPMTLRKIEFCFSHFLERNTIGEQVHEVKNQFLRETVLGSLPVSFCLLQCQCSVCACSCDVVLFLFCVTFFLLYLLMLLYEQRLSRSWKSLEMTLIRWKSFSRTLRMGLGVYCGKRSVSLQVF